MRKVIIGIVVISLLILASCSKNNTSGGYGSWTFKGTTYTAKSCSYLSGDSALGASDVTGAYAFTAANVIGVHFHAMPTSSGTYNLVSNFKVLAPNEASVNIYRYNTTGLHGYESTGHDNRTISVTVTNGKIRATGSNIILIDDTYATDSSTVSFDITQQ